MAKSTYQLARFKNFIDERCRKTFYHAYIHSKLEYGILLFGGAAAHQLRPIKSLQKRAVKLVVKNSSTNVFKAACNLPLKYLTDFQRSLLIMKSSNNKVFFFKSRLTGFKMQRACKLIMLVLIVYSGCENEIDLQTLIL